MNQHLTLGWAGWRRQHAKSNECDEAPPACAVGLPIHDNQTFTAMRNVA
jgi:hypothetical protein